MRQIRADVCVIGGGPAASSVALRLAKLGHAVCLIERGYARPPIAESLSPLAASLIKTLGGLEDFQHASMVWCEQTRLRWGEAADTLQHGRVAAIVERGRLDRLLLDAAGRAGTLLLRPARALIPSRHAEDWSIPVSTAREPLSVRAKFLVDARGKRSTLPPYGPSTVALSGRWREADLPPGAEMRVEACRDAWLWGAPLADGSFAVLAFVDTSRCHGLAREGRERLYGSLLEQSGLFSGCVGAKLLGDVGVRDATPRIDDEPVNENSIKIGDRALSLDPLSSQGLQRALRSGLQAAIVINTILRSGDKPAAIQFYRNMHQHSASLHCGLTQGVYASQSLHDSPFWRMRAGGASSRQPTSSTVVLSGDTRLRLAAEAQVISLPVIQGDMVCRRSALSHPDLDQPVAWLDDIELGPALETVKAEHSASYILSEWSRRMLPDNAERLLSWLTRRGILVTS